MAAITSQHIKAAFAAAAEVYDGKVTPGVATMRLHEDTGLNRGSAQDFIVQFRSMMRGDVFKRSISAEGAKYFLQTILQARGRAAADSALTAVWKHIAYYESLEQGHLNKLRSVATDFMTSLPEQISIDVENAQFSAQVVRSQRDTAEAREKRLV